MPSHRPRHQHPRARRRVAALLSIGLLVTGVATTAATSTASSAPAAPIEYPAESPAESRAIDLAALAPLAPDVPGVPHIARDLGAMAVDSFDYRGAAQAYTAAATALRDAQQLRHDSVRTLSELRVEQARLDAAVASATAREVMFRQRHDRVVGALNEIAIEAFIDAGTSTAEIDAFLDPKRANDPARQRVLTEATSEHLIAEEARLSRLLAGAAAARRAALDQRSEVARAATTARDDRDRAATTQIDTAEPVADARAELETARATATISEGDFALVALDAYRRAAATIAAEKPSCGVQWWALAGISRVEGRHGTYGSSELDAFGSATPAIIGIALNGERDTAVISDSDGGALDHDPVFDRAVGPMQFIPSTWRRWAADGDGDGEEDPHNLYDATLAAAGYLCFGRGGLGSDAGLRVAYFSYNHSEAYVENVLGHAHRYARIRVPDPADSAA